MEPDLDPDFFRKLSTGRYVYATYNKDYIISIVGGNASNMNE